MGSQIAHVVGREILDSRGYPTVEVDVRLRDGSLGRAAIPSGKSTGKMEAVERRDGDPGRFRGKGVQTVVRAVRDTIAPQVEQTGAEMGQAEFDQFLVDLDGTPSKERLGANVILGCSLAFARATAQSRGLSLVHHLAELYGVGSPCLPIPMMNVINGGQHADSGISTQEFMVVPLAASLSEAIRAGAETYHALREVLAADGHRVSVGDEGGFAPQLASTEEALEMLMTAVAKAGYQAGRDVVLALDFAANDFYRNGRYAFEGHDWTADDMTAYCVGLVERFPIVSVEDGLAEDDWDGWVRHTAELTAHGVQCVGDDIFVTNPRILQQGIDRGVANAVLIKLNQIGTLSETFAAMRLAVGAHYGTVVSHRSGETTDAFMADFAVATGASQMKSGAPARGERVAKYNQLLRIAEENRTIPMASGIYRSRA